MVRAKNNGLDFLTLWLRAYLKKLRYFVRIQEKSQRQ